MHNDTELFDDSTVDSVTSDTGIIDDRPILSIDVDDKMLISNFKRWISDSNSYWNDRKGYNLEASRNMNERYYLGKQIDKGDLYDYQVPFMDNQIYVGVQSIIAYVSANTPACDVVPEDDTVQSNVMAQDLETAVNIHTDKFKLNKLIKSVAKDVYINRIGIIKLKYDENLQDIVPVVVDPKRLILDKDCRQGEEPKFICEVCTDSVAMLFKKFPGKEKEIMEELGRSRKTNKLMSEIVAYNEVWFTDETADYGEQECVAWYFGDLVLDKIKNPNFLYDKEGLAIKNFIDAPTKPYVFFNYLNDGSSLIDQTSPIEQAIPLQDVLNKRGRQIIENADTANSILVLKSGAIKSEDAANITRDPNQILMLDAPDEQPINSAFGEVTPHLLPSYVIEDYQNTKNAIHNVLGTPSQFRGDDSKREVGTLGEAKMIQGQAGGRQDEMVRELEDGLDRYFRLLVQMMKVYYDEPKRLATRDNNGKFVSVQLSRATMPNIANISISHGSLLRVDRERQENISMNLAKMGLIDPYNLYKDLSLKDADKRYETLNKFRIDPSSLVSDISSEINDRDAYIDFSVFMNGEEAEPRKNIKPSYIEAATKLMSTDEFLYADPKKRQKWIEFIGNMVINLAQRAKVEEASQQGVLVDPNIPMEAKMPDQLDMLLQQEQPPQMPPGMMPEEAMPPVDAGQMPPMPEMGQGMPVQDVQQPQDASVLTGLLGV